VTPIHIPEEAYPYLVAQRGALDDMKDDAGLWCRRYAETLQSDFDCIERFLPERCDAVLDVGGGMGGINILLNAHYGGNLIVALLDGADDPPSVTKHAETFSNYRVARNFLQINGVENTMAISTARPFAPNFFDLVISLKSWCFHYEPAKYLDFVKGCSIAGKTRIILDVRGGLKGCPLGRSWEMELQDALSMPRIVHTGPKHTTMAFIA
jgi:hypothetical protein